MPVFRFDDITLDTEGFKLTQSGRTLQIEPLVFDTLALLVENSGRVVTKDEVIDTVWQGRFISDSTLSTAIKAARKVLGDSGDAQRLIRTVRGRGFEFVGTLENPATPTPLAPASPMAPGPEIMEPALYVRVSAPQGDAKMTNLAHALNARLRTILTRIPLLRLVMPYGQADALDNPRTLRAEHGVSLLTDLRLVQTGEIIQLDATLIETLGGTQCWARGYDVPNIGAAQEVLLSQVVRHLEPAIVAAMIGDLRQSEGQEPKALLLSAMGIMAQKGWNKPAFEEAEAMIETVIAQNPALPLSHAYLALIRAVGHRVGILRDDPDVLTKAISSANRALELETQDSMTLGLAGCALADAGQLRRAVPILKKSIEADPNNGHAKTALGAAYMLDKNFVEAERLLDEGIRISPADHRLGVWGTVLAMSRLALGKIEEAKAAAETAAQEDFRLYMPHLAFAAIALAEQDMEAASQAVSDCLGARPELALAEVEGMVGKELGNAIWNIVTAMRSTPEPV